MATIHVRADGKRGCGYRKEGGTYLVSSGKGTYCGRMPIDLNRCPCCDQGIKPARGWTWLDLDRLQGTEKKQCKAAPDHCALCPLSKPIGKVGLIWVGEQFYATPADFTEEAARLGISRRISRVPQGFKLGETWVALAHRKCTQRVCECGGNDKECERCGGTAVESIPGIFHLYRPDAIQYVVKGTETEEELDALEKRGITCVKVVHKDETAPLPV